MKTDFLSRIDSLIKIALEEDIGKGDITSNLLIPRGKRITAEIIAEKSGIIAGLFSVKLVYQKLSRSIRITLTAQDGDEVKKGSRLAVIEGQARAILTGERTVLNFLQRLSGIATLTNKFVKKVSGYKVKILDTRKTVPGWRFLDKYAVQIGGGFNHRFGLDDAVLIKGNHLRAIGADGIKKALGRMNNPLPPFIKGEYQRLEIEVTNLGKFRKTLELLKNSKLERAIIMLDNMRSRDVRQAVQIRNKVNKRILSARGGSVLHMRDTGKQEKDCIRLEVSGGINLSNVREFASTGVDFISVGMLTHSPKALDISMRVRDPEYFRGLGQGRK
jgi:nicotinate-nucleotide pyrophosphorylase (carboxylating)